MTARAARMNRNQHTLDTFPAHPAIGDDPAVARFAAALRAVRGASPHTVANYLRDVGQLDGKHRWLCSRLLHGAP